MSVELYQPLDYASRWFVNPKLSYENASTGVFRNDNQIALFRSEQTAASLAVGRNFGNWGEVRLAVSRSYSNDDIEIGELDLSSDSSELTNFELSFQYDTIDRVSVPRSGLLIALDWLGLRDGFGANQSVDALSLIVLKPQTWGENTLLHWWNIGSVVNEGNEPLEPFRLGGLFSLSGLAPNVLRGQHLVIGRSLFYRRLGDEESSILKMPVYLGASLEAGNVWQDKDDVDLGDLSYSASAFVVLDSVIGPLYLAYGRNDNGNGSGYLFLGQTF